MIENITEKKELTKIRIYSFIFAALLGFLHAWFARFSMTSDGMTYLDMADYFSKFDFKNAILASWCPLYPLILSIVFSVFRPSTYFEFPFMHFVDFFIYLFTFLSFDYFLQQFINYQKKLSQSFSGKNYLFVSDKATLLLGYSLFVFTSLHLVSLWSPDMLFSAAVYLATGVLLKLYTGKTQTGNFLFLGLILGLGYLAKTPMFILSFIYFLGALFSESNISKSFKKVFLAILVFVLISAPYIFSISASKGYLTIGDSGKLNYAWYINDTPFFVHWQGGPGGNGKPIHPTRKIFENPPAYEFNGPVGGTYPAFYDPTYWYQGIKPRFDFFRQFCGVCAGLQIYGELFFKLLGVLFFAICLLIYMSGRKNAFIKDVFQEWILFLPSLFAFFMFSLVHLELRYIAPYIVLFWIGLFSTVRFPLSKNSEKLLNGTVFLASIMLLIISANMTSKEITGLQKVGSIHTDWKVAKGLEKLGIKKGDKVVTIGYSVPYSAYWARLARVKIVAEVTRQDAEKFWSQKEEVKKQLMKAFAKTGAKVVVTSEFPKYYPQGKWIKVEDTTCFAYFL